jgi:predicted metal-dependent hydrolase
MKAKEFVLDEQTTIKVYKRSSSRSIRISLDPSGEVRVSIPNWVPYKAAVEFAKSKREWIKAKRPQIKLLEDNQRIGKNNRSGQEN